MYGRNARLLAASIAAALGVLVPATAAVSATPTHAVAAKKKKKKKAVRLTADGWYVNGAWEGPAPGKIKPGGTDDYCADTGGGQSGGPNVMIAYYKVGGAPLPKGTHGSLTGPGVSVNYATGRALYPSHSDYTHTVHAGDPGAPDFQPGTYTFALRRGSKTLVTQTINLVAVRNGKLSNGDTCGP